jgi:hypothetical protein
MNIFVLHTPFQLYTAQLVIEQYMHLAGSQNVLVYEGSAATEIIRDDLWGEIHFIPSSRGFGRGPRKIVEEGHDLLVEISKKSSGRPSMVLSDMAWPLNNRVFFSGTLEKLCDYYILSDGIATYTCPELSTSQRLHNVVKSLLGKIGLTARFSPYWVSMLGADHRRVRGIYSFRAALLEGLYSCRLFDISLEAIAGQRDKEDALFLDQPYRDLMDPLAWGHVRTDTLRWLSASGFRKIYYKKHPMCDSRYRDELRGIDMEDIDSELPAELLFHSLSVGTVISYTSGALFNLKSLAGEGIRAVAYKPHVFLAVDGSGGRSRRSLVEVFESVGVEVVDESVTAQ